MTGDPVIALGLADLGVKILAALGAGIAFVVAIRQYRQGQAWQRSQIVLSLIDSFENSDRIQAACGMIDWDRKAIPMPSGRILNYENRMLVGALRVPVMDIQSAGPSLHGSEPTEGSFSEEESFVRDAFDAFLDFFDKVYAFRRANLLLTDDYAYFCYWLELVRDIGHYKQDERIGEALTGYIESYRFAGIRRLLDEYNSNPRRLVLGVGVTDASSR